MTLAYFPILSQKLLSTVKTHSLTETSHTALPLFFYWFFPIDVSVLLFLQFPAPCLVSESVAMEGKGPYRIYDPGGGEAKPREAREEGSSGGGGSYRLLLEENSVLRERMKGLKSLGPYLLL